MKLRKIQGGSVSFFCPGCERAHVVPIAGVNAWWWNESLSAPTLNPSVRVRYPGTDAGRKGAPPACCHSFVKDGKIMFLADSTHALAGKTVPMVEFE